jgi:hypothetical protein
MQTTKWTNQKSKKQKVIQFLQTSYFHKSKENFDYFSHFPKTSFVRPEHILIILQWHFKIALTSKLQVITQWKLHVAPLNNPIQEITSLDG